MEEHLGIYDKLDEIKHLIPEQNYIELCDEASSLLKYIETYKNLVDSFRESTDDEEIYTDVEDAEEYDPNLEVIRKKYDKQVSNPPGSTTTVSLILMMTD